MKEVVRYEATLLDANFDVVERHSANLKFEIEGLLLEIDFDHFLEFAVEDEHNFTFTKDELKTLRSLFTTDMIMSFTSRIKNNDGETFTLTITKYYK